MPIYEYECTKCREVFEELVFGSEKDVRCPRCSSKKVNKLMSAPSLPDAKKGLSGGLNTATPTQGSCGSGGFS